MTMLVTWLIEIYLNQLGELKEQQLESSPRYQTLQKEFQTFLKQTRVKVSRLFFFIIFFLTSRSPFPQSHRLLGMNQYIGELKVSCTRKLHSGHGVGNLDLSLQSLMLYHWSTAPSKICLKYRLINPEEEIRFIFDDIWWWLKHDFCQIFMKTYLDSTILLLPKYKILSL